MFPIRQKSRVSSLRPSCSIVMPVYRGTTYLEEAVQSVLEQKRVDLELIIVDDGSPEDVGQRLSHIRDARLRIQRQGSRGAARARNAGLLLAHGKSVLFLDAGDRLRPHALRRLWRALERNPSAPVAYGRVRRIDLHGRRIGYLARPIGTPEPSGDVLRPMLQQELIGCAGAALIRKSRLDADRAFNPAAFPVAEWELWCRLAALGPFVALRGRPIVDLRIHPDDMALGFARDPQLVLRSLDLVFGNPDLRQRFSTAEIAAMRRRREASVYGWLGTECLRASDFAGAEHLLECSRECRGRDLRISVLLAFARAHRRPPWL